jgi:hypothetical protein
MRFMFKIRKRKVQRKLTQIGFFYNARIYALEMPKFTMDFSNEFFPPRLYLF